MSDKPNTEPTPPTITAAPPPDPVAEAEKLLAQDRQQRVEAFLAEYTALCKRHGIQLGAEPQIINGLIVANPVPVPFRG